jgi:hypothetical protein
MSQRRKRKGKRDPLMGFVYRSCIEVMRITSTLVESLVDIARGKGLAKDPLETIQRIIRFAKRHARLEPEARRYIERKFGFVHVPDSAVFS